MKKPKTGAAQFGGSVAAAGDARRNHDVAAALKGAGSRSKGPGGAGGRSGGGGGGDGPEGPRKGSKGASSRQVLPPTPLFLAFIAAMVAAGYEPVQIMRKDDAAALGMILGACGGDEAKAKRFLEGVVASWRKIRIDKGMKDPSPSLRVMASRWLESLFPYAFPPVETTATGAVDPNDPFAVAMQKQLAKDAAAKAARINANARSQEGKT